MALHLAQDLFVNAYLFSDLDTVALAKLMAILRPSKYNADDEIFKAR